MSVGEANVCGIAVREKTVTFQDAVVTFDPGYIRGRFIFDELLYFRSWLGNRFYF